MRRFLVLLALFAAVACNSGPEDCAPIDISCSPSAALYLIPRPTGSPFFVTVSFTGLTATSRDATRWAMGPATGLSLQRLATGSGTFVASGSNSVIAYTRDGTSWTTSPSLTTGEVRGGGHYNGMLVAAGEDASSNATFFTSADGTNWNSFPVTAGLYETMSVGNGRIIGCGGDGTITCATSADGTTYLSVTPAGITHLKSSAFLNGTFIFPSLSAGGKYAVTRDGINWEVHLLPGATSAQLFGVASNGSRMVFGDFSNGLHVIENGNYTRITLATGVVGVAYAGGTFVATGAGGRLYVSADGYNWETYTLGSDQWSGVAVDFR